MEPNAAPTQVMHSRVKMAIRILTIFMYTLVIVTLSSYVTYRILNLQTQKRQQPVQQKMRTQLLPMVKSSPVPTIDITMDWIIYQNQKCKYSVKYPTDWETSTLPITGGSDQVYQEDIVFKPKNSKFLTSSDKELTYYTASLSAAPANDLSLLASDSSHPLWKYWKNKKVQYININGVRTVEAEGDSYGIHEVELYFFTNECYFELKGIGSYVSTFTQMLSTFRFTN